MNILNSSLNKSHDNELGIPFLKRYPKTATENTLFRLISFFSF